MDYNSQILGIISYPRLGSKPPSSHQHDKISLLSQSVCGSDQFVASRNNVALQRSRISRQTQGEQDVQNHSLTSTTTELHHCSLQLLHIHLSPIFCDILGLFGSQQKHHLHRLSLPRRLRHDRSRAQYRESEPNDYRPAIYSLVSHSNREFDLRVYWHGPHAKESL